MVNLTKVHPTLPVTDLKRAKKFYSETLGLKLTDEGEVPGHLAYDAGDGTFLMVYARPTPPTSDATSAAFAVDNVEAVVKELKNRGVTFEVYDMPGVEWNDVVATMGNMKGAWFKDPDGNILAVSQAA
jgi:catechol 2,3-dioxygenase-like lactoylglutathione lyase family enzyme